MTLWVRVLAAQAWGCEFESQAPVYITCVYSWNCCLEGILGPPILTSLKRGSGRRGSVEIKCHHVWSWEEERHGEIHIGWGEVCLQCHLEREALWCWGGRAEGLEPAPGSHSYLCEVVFLAQLCENSRELSVRQSLALVSEAVCCPRESGEPAFKKPSESDPVSHLEHSETQCQKIFLASKFDFHSFLDHHLDSIWELIPFILWSYFYLCTIN